ncbi:AAA ATPase-like protein [Kribbella amoyensis]|uniref:AAA ATPase-like protein n=1 Tax=Kribbella amoyensis TaxID=996641 RepID=A0A561BX60_9ACTN|nr:MoxR family ATPase [Kribbella amoyensis]TWD83322.1 AAA ATPase-like protein [Kribbella amoyensis]
MNVVGGAEELAERLRGTGYLADGGLATVGYLALALDRPLLLEGEPGTGKTALAAALAEALELPLIRLQCYEGIDATQALYDWDFPRQILHLRTIEATSRGTVVDRRQSESSPDAPDDGSQDVRGRDGDGSGRGSSRDGDGSGGRPSRGGDGFREGRGRRDEVEEIERSLFDERFLLARPVLRALRESPAVLLVDEIDRADDEFEAFLLEVLSTHEVTIPEFGTITAAVPPIVVLTSNRTREVHDALKRRCLYHWIDHPGLEREVEIVRTRLPGVSRRLAEQVALSVHRMRELDLLKPPGVAETLDWARAIEALGTDTLDIQAAAATLGAVLKYREDTDRVRESLDRLLAS